MILFFQIFISTNLPAHTDNPLRFKTKNKYTVLREKEGKSLQKGGAAELQLCLEPDCHQRAHPTTQPFGNRITACSTPQHNKRASTSHRDTAESISHFTPELAGFN